MCLTTQSTVNDVLDMKAMTSGSFKLQPKPTTLTNELMLTLRRCRAFMQDDVRFTYSIPAGLEENRIVVDVLRLSQILTNALRCVLLGLCQYDCLIITCKVDLLAQW